MPGLKKKIIAIYGPTAVGKSAAAVETARALDGEVVSADSMQVYRGIPIITDQPGEDLLAAVPHHLVGFLPLDEEYSAARFARDAAAAIESIVARGRVPVLVGGTGLYIRALLGGFTFAGSDAGRRDEWELFVARHGREAALEALAELDPEAAALIDTANPRRLVRALEAAATGAPLSAERERLWSGASPYQVASFALELPREELYRRIEARVDAMMSAGAVDEVRRAHAGSLSRTAAQAIGMQEIIVHLERGASLAETAAAIKQKSRNYAKRQLTWMRKMPDVARIDVSGLDPAAVAKAVVNHIHSANDTPSY